MASAKAALLTALVVFVSACGGTTATTDSPGTIVIPNHGGAQEGHTPTGFAGSGTGLFAGDNLNPTFPEGQGVQIFLTFALRDQAGEGSAIVTSDVLQTIGTPFEDLGDLLIEPISYDAFGPELFDLEANAVATRCTAADTTVQCDVTAAVAAATAAGQTVAQFRLRFEQAADSDGEADLALFYRSDSNTNEPGLFELVMTSP
jgi:hypothetical protein